MTTMRNSCGGLKDYWYVAARSEDLGRKAPIGRVLLGEMIALYRNLQGQPVALIDRCLHRNAMLSKGDVFDGYLGCPYHGWSYDDQGRCVNVPSQDSDFCPRPGKTLETFPALEQDGLIWVYLGDPTAITVQPFRMPHHGEPGWQSYYMVTTFPNNVTNLVENFMDVPHTLFVHAGSFRNRKRNEGRATVRRTADSVLVDYDFPADSIGFTRYLLNPDNQPMTHTDKFYMPNVTRVDYDFGPQRSFIITSQCTPITPYESIVYTAITFRFGLFNYLLNPFFRIYTRYVIEQDVDIMRNQGQGLRHYGGNSFMSTEADVIHDYIESLRDHVANGNAGLPPEPRETGITFAI